MNPFLIIFNIILFTLLVCLYFPQTLSGKYREKTSNKLFFITSLIIFGTFAFSSGDFLNYESLIELIILSGKRIHIETPYYWILSNISDSYLIWRMCVWGSSAIFSYLVLKKISLDNTSGFCAFVIFNILSFYNMRGNLGVSMFFYGMTLLFVNPQKKVIQFVVAAFIIILSYYFHKSMIIYFLLIPLSLIIFKRTIYTLSLICFPIIVVLVGKIITYIMNFGLEFVDEEISNSAQLYSGIGMFQTNVMGYVREVFVFGPTYLGLFFFMKNFVYKKNALSKLPPVVCKLFSFWYWMVYVATVCAFQTTGGWYFPRLMLMSTLPFALVMGFVLRMKNRPKLLKSILYLGLWGGYYDLLYTFYISIR